MTTFWTGAAQLEPLLRPIGELRTHPHNPRRGVQDGIVRSLERHGQLKPLVVDQEGTILAGNQVYLAVVERFGWTHVAVVEYAADDVEAYLYLVDDNASGDVAGYDQREAQVAADGLWALVGAAREQLEATTDPVERDRQAHTLRGLESAHEYLATHAQSRKAGGTVDPNAIEITHYCQDPRCGYEWRGNG